MFINCRNMMLIKRTAFSSKGMVPYLKKQNQIVYPLGYQFASEKLIADRFFQSNLITGEIQRLLHTSRVNRDLEAGLRAVGAGMAASGMIGSGIGVGQIFGSLTLSVARNPSIAKQVFTNAVMGAAFCESIGLFAMMIAFIIM